VPPDPPNGLSSLALSKNKEEFRTLLEIGLRPVRVLLAFRLLGILPYETRIGCRKRPLLYQVDFQLFTG
jgi:hypothetical protein